MPNKPTYTIKIECSNCDHIGDIKIPKGKAVCQKMECPNCGCKTASKHVPRFDLPQIPDAPWQNPYRLPRPDETFPPFIKTDGDDFPPLKVTFEGQILSDHVAFAAEAVQSWPKWQRGLLQASAQPKLTTPRTAAH